MLISRMKMLEESKQNQLSDFLSSIISKIHQQDISTQNDIESEIQQYQYVITEQQAKNSHLKKELDKKTQDLIQLQERYNLKRANYKKVKAQINSAQIELTNQLQDKDQTIANLKKELETSKTNLTQEAQKLRDELDIAKHKLSQSQSNQQTLDRYKRKLEEMADLQLRQKELEKTNLQLTHTIKMQAESLSKISEIESGYEFFKISFAQEKEKLAQIEQKLADKEQNLRQAEHKIKELMEEINLLSSRLGENYRRISDTPENTSGIFEAKDIGMDIQQELEEQLQKLQTENRSLIEKFQQQKQVMNKEQMAEILSSKAALEEKLFKEQTYNKKLTMANEDLQFEVDKLKREIKIYKQDVSVLQTKLEKFESNLNELQQKNTQIQEENEYLKKDHLKTLQEIQNIIVKKEEINSLYLQIKEEYLHVNSALMEKEKQLQNCLTTLSTLESKILVFQEKEGKMKSQIEDLTKSKQEELSKSKIMTLESEKRELEQSKQIDQLNVQIKEIEENATRIQQEKIQQKHDFERQVEETKKQSKKHYTEKINNLKLMIGQQQVELEYHIKVIKELKEKFNQENELLCAVLFDVGKKIIKQS